MPNGRVRAISDTIARAGRRTDNTVAILSSDLGAHGVTDQHPHRISDCTSDERANDDAYRRTESWTHKPTITATDPGAIDRRSHARDGSADRFTGAIIAADDAPNSCSNFTAVNREAELISDGAPDNAPNDAAVLFADCIADVAADRPADPATHAGAYSATVNTDADVYAEHYTESSANTSAGASTHTDADHGLAHTRDGAPLYFARAIALTDVSPFVLPDGFSVGMADVSADGVANTSANTSSIDTAANSAANCASDDAPNSTPDDTAVVSADTAPHIFSDSSALGFTDFNPDRCAIPGPDRHTNVRPDFRAASEADAQADDGGTHSRDLPTHGFARTLSAPHAASVSRTDAAANEAPDTGADCNAVLGTNTSSIDGLADTTANFKPDTHANRSGERRTI